MKSKSNLVCYSNPFLVYSGQENDKAIKNFKLHNFVPLRKTSFDKRVEIWKWIDDLEQNSNIEELLNTIITPIKYKEGGNIWLQTPVSFPATNRDVVNLWKALGKRLIDFGAKDYGICHIREEFYFQCFDELIRQVIINYKKQGLMLSLIRDYFKGILLFYRNLYISGSCYGIRKEISSCGQKEQLKESITVLDTDVKLVESEVLSLEERIKTKKEEFAAKQEVK